MFLNFKCAGINVINHKTMSCRSHTHFSISLEEKIQKFLDCNPSSSAVPFRPTMTCMQPTPGSIHSKSFRMPGLKKQFTNCDQPVIQQHAYTVTVLTVCSGLDWLWWVFEIKTSFWQELTATVNVPSNTRNCACAAPPDHLRSEI